MSGLALQVQAGWQKWRRGDKQEWEKVVESSLFLAKLGYVTTYAESSMRC